MHFNVESAFFKKASDLGLGFLSQPVAVKYLKNSRCFEDNLTGVATTTL
jgi:hypothetical protein